MVVVAGILQGFTSAYFCVSLLFPKQCGGVLRACLVEIFQVHFSTARTNSMAGAGAFLDCALVVCVCVLSLCAHSHPCSYQCALIRVFPHVFFWTCSACSHICVLLCWSFHMRCAFMRLLSYALDVVLICVFSHICALMCVSLNMCSNVCALSHLCCPPMQSKCCMCSDMFALLCVLARVQCRSWLVFFYLRLFWALCGIVC